MEFSGYKDCRIIQVRYTHTFIPVWRDMFVLHFWWWEAVPISSWLVLKHFVCTFSFSFFFPFFFFNIFILICGFKCSLSYQSTGTLLDYQGTSRCHTRRMTVFQNKLCSPLGSGIDEYVSVTRHRKQLWKGNPMLSLNVKETIHSFWGA